jgi:glycine cleavage system protein P-like pyridoxal-binding family
LRPVAERGVSAFFSPVGTQTDLAPCFLDGAQRPRSFPPSVPRRIKFKIRLLKSSRITIELNTFDGKFGFILCAHGFIRPRDNPLRDAGQHAVLEAKYIKEKQISSSDH